MQDRLDAFVSLGVALYTDCEIKEKRVQHSFLQGYSRQFLVFFEKSSFAIYVEYVKFIYSRSEVMDVLLG